MTTTSKVGTIGTATLAAALAAVALLGRPGRPDATVIALKQHVHDLTREFSALEAGRFVPPEPIIAPDGTRSGTTLTDQYSLALEQGTHRLEDVATIALEIPLYDLAVARTPEARSAAGAHVQHGLATVRKVLDEEFGRNQDEYNEADVLVRIRGALLQIEALPDVKK